MLLVTGESVQQPCSDLSKSPEFTRKASTQKYICLREFCKLWEPPVNIVLLRMAEVTSSSLVGFTTKTYYFAV